MSHASCVKPGGFCYDDDTNIIAFVVSVIRPPKVQVEGAWRGWEITLLAQGRLIITENFGSRYTMVP